MEKTVKLQPKLRKLTYSEKEVPELKVSGLWLESLGFKAGQRVTIIASKGELTIKPCLREAPAGKLAKQWK